MVWEENNLIPVDLVWKVSSLKKGETLDDKLLDKYHLFET